MTTIAFIGLGVMGAPMAGHLARAARETGGSVLVWNRTTAKAEAHARQYGTVVADLPQIAQADLIFTCLPTSTEVDEMLAQLKPHLKRGTTWVDCTSGHPAAALRQRQELEQLGVAFLDAPVSGGQAGAEAGTLTVMLGGPANEVQAVIPQLAFAGKTVHVGDTSTGFSVKAVNNALLAVNLWATGEGLATLGKAGVNIPAALDVINASSGRSNASQNLIGQRVLSREFSCTFALGLLAKDATIATDLIGSVQASAPVLMQTASLIRAASQQIGPQQDHSAALKLVEQMNGQELQ